MSPRQDAGQAALSNCETSKWTPKPPQDLDFGADGWLERVQEWLNQNQAALSDILVTILNFALFSSPIGSIGYTAVQNEEGVRRTSQTRRLVEVA
ncbi:hypothetical protein, partial [Bradyrhizobium viridifuturi]|uniref:hypothetical protein n=1 Tax=Bradyrhizobium viridifuturi TaxID=1654716 RepID=UPI001AEC4C23